MRVRVRVRAPGLFCCPGAAEAPLETESIRGSHSLKKGSNLPTQQTPILREKYCEMAQLALLQLRLYPPGQPPPHAMSTREHWTGEGGEPSVPGGRLLSPGAEWEPGEEIHRCPPAPPNRDTWKGEPQESCSRTVGRSACQESWHPVSCLDPRRAVQIRRPTLWPLELGMGKFLSWQK